MEDLNANSTNHLRRTVSCSSILPPLLSPNMPFTFYGDLLGISSVYKLSAAAAREKLNRFYNSSFNVLDPDWERANGVRTIMFSDSILITGRRDENMLVQLQALYLALSSDGLLLRGALVENEVRFEPRITRDNFQKMLPEDDTLARSVGLAGSFKGARLIIENAVARRLLVGEPEWITQDGYVHNPVGSSRPTRNDIIRRIAPTPDGTAYECLYFWPSEGLRAPVHMDFAEKRDQLNEIKKMVREDIGEHYKETLGLLNRCESRASFTAKHV
jgi:hypothetical protein